MDEPVDRVSTRQKNQSEQYGEGSGNSFEHCTSCSHIDVQVKVRN